MEAGLITLSKPIFSLKQLAYDTGDDGKFQEHISQCIAATNKAIELFNRAAVCSSTKPRSIFWLVYATTLQSIFKEASDQEKTSIFNRHERSKSFDVAKHYSQTSLAYFHTLGWVRRSVSTLAELGEDEITFLKNQLEKAIESYANVVLSQGFLPNIEFAFAGYIWDSTPDPTPELTQIVLRYLNNAVKKAQKCIEYNIGTMGIIWYSKVVPAGEFIKDVQQIIEKIKLDNPSDRKKAILLQALW